LTLPLYALLAVPRDGASGGMVLMVQMGLVFAIFYFLLIRPQAKERKRHDDMLKNLSKGDEIITNGGIIGMVVHVEESRLTVKTGDNTRLTVDRGRIAVVIDPKAGTKDAKDE
jgi:preprotein translocase subunit YajC